jgi:hypothetical protein
MQRIVIGLLALLLAFLGGCGGSAPQPKALPSLHGGEMIELPDARGFVELITEGRTPARSSRKAITKSQITAYFYQPDATTTMSPAPKDVKVVLGNLTVKLAPQPSVPGAFASEPGDFTHELRGHVDFELEGKNVQADFSMR